MGGRNDQFSSSLEIALQSALGEVEELRDEIQEWYDNLPESLQGSDKGAELEECAQALQDICDALEQADQELEQLTGLGKRNVNYHQDRRKKARSRSCRLSNAQAIISAIHGSLPPGDPATDDFCDALDSADFDNVNFPGMY